MSTSIGSFAGSNDSNLNYNNVQYKDSDFYKSLDDSGRKDYDQAYFDSEFDKEKIASDNAYTDENLAKYKKAADLAFGYYKGKVQAQGDDQRATMKQGYDNEWAREARDNAQARRAYQY